MSTFPVPNGIPSKITMSPGNNSIIAVSGLYDKFNKVYLDGTVNVTATLYDSNNNPVAGCIGVTLNYVANSYGGFVGVVQGVNFNPPLGTGYRTNIVATQAGNKIVDLSIDTEIEPRSKN